MAEKSFNYTNHPAWFNVYVKIQLKLLALGLERVGECNHCGDCCKTIDISVDFGEEDYEVIGKEDVYCKAYDSTKQQCNNYLLRPLLCRLFPMQPEDLKYLPNCSYKFVKIKKEK